MAARRIRCVTCKKHFDARNSRAMYCSESCRNLARRGARSKTAPDVKKPTSKRGLTVLGPDSPAPDPTPEDKPKILSVSEASETDDPLLELYALRRVIARDIDSSGTNARDRATATRQLLEIRRQIEALKAAGEEDPLGDAALTPDEEFDPTAY